ncbi:MAG TPA: histidine phosphatase family protein [Chitinophagales bacterium]|jgi:probable phosphoglycerate mutase|nr:histidine phosphatase family protein [Chitinophagales bacterium]HPA35324.1 histidine phosphatase family protein [Chitinophagales bacterium]HQO31616.1 histidine phosphatase family protein [Chitinophagales bacterium]HQO88891.1 histidine phosphatase family protein [Chitinophagales bacterium]
MKKTIYIIRHGQTDFNVKQVVQGRGVNSDLNETGRRQAQAFFDKYHPVDFDVVYTSKLKRTHQTVAHFISKNIPHEIRENIDEIDWGIFEGVEHDKSLQKEYYDIIESWAKGNLTIKIEGGESAQDLADRLIPFVEEIKQSEHQSVLVCTHGRTLRVLMCLLLEKPVSAMDEFDHQNTGLYVLRFDGNKFSLDLENDISHLNTNSGSAHS